MICVELNDLILDCVLAMRRQHEVCGCQDDDAQARMEARRFAKLKQFLAIGQYAELRQGILYFQMCYNVFKRSLKGFYEETLIIYSDFNSISNFLQG